MTEKNSDTTSDTTDEHILKIEKDILAARNLIRNGNLEQAHQSLTKLIETDSSGYAKLQLANAYVYLQRYTESVTLIDTLLVQAKEQRDALLTIAALLTKGEAIIDMVSFPNKKDGDDIEVQSAIESFGQALGISELLGEERLSILPLAGLAHSHWLWGNPKKAAELAERSLVRAETIDTAERDLFLARAYLSVAITQQTSDAFHKAIKQATLANHRPLEGRIKKFKELYQD